MNAPADPPMRREGPSAVTVRTERPGEAEAIRAINIAAFGGPLEAQIVDDIRGTDRWIAGGSLVAEGPASELIGHLLVSEGDLADEAGTGRRVWMLGPVAVTPSWQRRGVGTALMHAAIAFATAKSQPLLLLLGHSDYYPRFGFESARRLGIEPPRPWRDENWMALRLPAWDPSLRGTARFPAAFPDSQ